MNNKLNNKLLNYKTVVFTVFLALMGLSSFTYAEQTVNTAQVKKQEPLKVVLTAQKVSKDAKGKEFFSSADKVKPGEVLEYRAVYANVSEVGLSGVVATLPVPKGMEYVDRSANPAAATATVDGVTFEDVPLKRKVKDKAGKEVLQLVPVAEYKALRWILGDIQAGKEQAVSLRVSVAK